MPNDNDVQRTVGLLQSRASDSSARWHTSSTNTAAARMRAECSPSIVPR
jgi:hypothetical protein